MLLSALFSIGIGIGLVGWGIDVVVRGLRARRWPHVTGAIIASEVRRELLYGFAEWFPRIRYRYTVGHQSFEGDRIAFGSLAMREWFAHQFAGQYRVGANVRIHYDPRNHEKSVLHPSVGLTAVRTTIAFVGGTLLLLNGIVRLAPPLVGGPGQIPGQEPDHLQRARDFESKGWKRDAEAEFRLAIQVHPNDPEPHYWMGDYLLGAHRNGAAAAEFQKAVQIKPHAPSYAGLAYLALDRKAFIEASELASRVIALDPGYKEGFGYLERAVALHHLGKNLEAVRDASSACRVGNRQACVLVKEWRRAQGSSNN